MAVSGGSISYGGGSWRPGILSVLEVIIAMVEIDIKISTFFS